MRVQFPPPRAIFIRTKKAMKSLYHQLQEIRRWVRSQPAELFKHETSPILSEAFLLYLESRGIFWHVISPHSIDVADGMTAEVLHLRECDGDVNLGAVEELFGFNLPKKVQAAQPIPPPEAKPPQPAPQASPPAGQPKTMSDYIAEATTLQQLEQLHKRMDAQFVKGGVPVEKMANAIANLVERGCQIATNKEGVATVQNFLLTHITRSPGLGGDGVKSQMAAIQEQITQLDETITAREIKGTL